MPVPSATLDVGRFESPAALQQEGQPDVLAEMVGLFEDETRGWMALAREAARTADMVTLCRVAHSLKGVCGAIGASRMRALAITLEGVVGAGKIADLAVVVEAMTDEFDRLMDLLRPYVPDHGVQDYGATADR